MIHSWCLSAHAQLVPVGSCGVRRLWGCCSIMSKHIIIIVNIAPHHNDALLPQL